MPVLVRSALPGRVRWDAPELLNRPSIAAALEHALAEIASVRRVTANPITGRVLLEFDPLVPVPVAEGWVDEALARARAAPRPVRMRPLLPKGKHGHPERLTSPGSPLSRLLERTDRHRSLVTLTFATSFFNRLFEATPPLMIGTAVDVVTRGPKSVLGLIGFKTVSSQLWALGGLSLVLWTIDAAVGYAQKVLSAELANRVRHDLRNEVYDHLQTLDMAQIEKRGVAGWMMVLDDDIRQIHKFIDEGVDPIVTIAANGVIVFGTFAVLSPGLAAAQLLMLPPLVIASTKMLKPIKERFMASRAESEQLHEVLHGNVVGLPTITAFNTQEQEAGHVERASLEHMEAERRAYKLAALYVPSLQMIVGGGFITTLVWGGSLVSRGQLAAGAYNVMAFSELRLLVALGRLGVSMENYQRTKVSIERILHVLDLQPSIQSGPRALPPARMAGDVVFDKVEFGYERDRKVLKGIDLHFPAGRTTGIVGESGAGKSTVLKMLLRFYDAQGGAVRLDGTDVKELALGSLRSSIATVPQEIVLFAGTIRDNIAYARPDASLDEVIHAARIAEAHEFITELPKGYDTRVGNGARGLSTGQKQRIAIARAALADRPIVLFDEATSGLDNETEAAVQRSLQEVTAGKTTVIVAHRLSTIRHADLIYVLDDGQVREQGQHDELIARDGIYASMWRVQTGELPKKPRPRKRS
jgi:ATP-binding cassette subfamily B protein